MWRVSADGRMAVCPEDRSAGQELVQIAAGGLLVLKERFRVGYIAGLILIRFMEGWLPDQGGLREEQAGCPGVAGLGCGLYPCLPGHICAYALVDRHVLKGQIIVIFIVRVKVAQIPFIQRDAA